VESPALRMFLEPYKAAAAEGAALELKWRLLAGKVPALRQYANEQNLKDFEEDLAKHFAGFLSDEEKETLRLCRQLRNKVLHADFCAARNKLNELGVETPSGGVKKIDLFTATSAEIPKKILEAKTGTEGTPVAGTSFTNAGGVFGWFLEAGTSGDFDKASKAFKDAAAIIDRLAGLEFN
jgi:hypothetical protein